MNTHISSQENLKPPLDHGLRQISDDGLKLVGEQYAKALDELETLYIIDNISGRLKFLKKFPVLAKAILGEALIQCDVKGTDDYAARAALEDEAELRLEEFIDIFVHVEKRSVFEKALQTEYIEQTVRKLGKEISLLLYDKKIVERYFPSEAVVMQSSEPVREVRAEEKPVQEALPPAVQETPAVESPAIGAPVISSPVISTPVISSPAVSTEADKPDTAQTE